MSLRLASFRVNGRTSYGAVTDKGIVDLGRKLSAKYPTLLDILRADATGEARGAASGQPDHQLGDVEILIPIPAPEKIICVGINYPERNEEYKDGRPHAEISEPVRPLSILIRRARPAAGAAQGIGQVRL